MTKLSAPKSEKLVAQQMVNVNGGQSVEIPAASLLSQKGTFTLVVTLEKGGNDIWFQSIEAGAGPELLVTFDDPDGKHSTFGEPANGRTPK